MPNLFGTGCFNSPVSLVKIKAGLLEGQFTVIENTTHLSVEVCDYLFVVYIQHISRDYPVPVVHQCLILDIIFAQLSQVITKGLAAGEKLFVAAEATVHRVAPGIDNLGIGYGEMQ